MFESYLTTALHTLSCNKAYADINVTSLSISIAAYLLFFLILQFETSFDNFHRKRTSIHRPGTQQHNGSEISCVEGISFPAAHGLGHSGEPVHQSSDCKSGEEFTNGVISNE